MIPESGDCPVFPSLHQLVREGDLDGVKRVVLQGADLCFQDERRWTALHHAALLPDSEIYEFLLQQGMIKGLDLENLRNDLNGTPRDFLKLTGRQKTLPPQFYFEENGIMQEGSDELFYNLTKAYLTAEIFATQEDLLVQWQEGLSLQPSTREKVYDKMFSSGYFAYCKKAPRVYLKKADVSGIDAGYNLHAYEKILKGSVVAEYTGRQVSPGQKDGSSYLFGPINAQSQRGLAAMIADGFPNVFPVWLYRKRGMPVRIIFVALEDILPGDVLCFNYGPNHSVKLLPHGEFRKESMAAFFKNNSLQSLAKEAMKLLEEHPAELGWKKTLRLEACASRLQYLFQTPSTLKGLLQEKIVEKQEVICLFKDYRIRRELLLLKGEDLAALLTD